MRTRTNECYHRKSTYLGNVRLLAMLSENTMFNSNLIIKTIFNLISKFLDKN